jgi:hypothetical protein
MFILFASKVGYSIFISFLDIPLDNQYPTHFPMRFEMGFVKPG